jgi:hypothetical protein
MRTGVYYLNNSGSRWVNLFQGKRATHDFQTKSGKTVTRVANFYQSFGNFATINISWKGKKINVFADTILED